MISNENIIKLIEHYQDELGELYSLLRTLEDETFLKNHNAEGKDLSELKSHIRYLSFFIASFLDILVSLKVLYESNLRWDRKFHIKNAFVTIFETIQTYNKHQKDIRLLIKSKYPHLESDYEAVAIKMREFKKKHNYDTEISTFRNKAGAHYDENYDEYIQNLINIDKPKSIIAIKEYGDVLDAILDFWGKLIDELYNQIK